MCPWPDADRAAYTLSFCTLTPAMPLRLDAYIHQVFPHISRRDHLEALADGQVAVNQRPAKKSTLIKGQEEISLSPETTCRYALTALQPDPAQSIAILYEDDVLFAIHKPVGIDTLPQRLSDRHTLGNALLARWPTLAHVGQNPFDCGLLQRLDRDTSGIVLGAKSQDIWNALHAQMRAGEISKYYLARVEGHPDQTSGEIDYLLTSRGKHAKRVHADPTQTGLQHTHWRVLKRYPDHTTLLEVTITQGARHQIRAHLSAIGHPIWGDSLYGAASQQSHYQLHAQKLSLRHPLSSQPLLLESPPPSWSISNSTASCLS